MELRLRKLIGAERRGWGERNIVDGGGTRRAGSRSVRTEEGAGHRGGLLCQVTAGW